MKKLTFVLLLTLCVSALFSQDKKEQATEKRDKAVELMDAGKADEAITLLEEAKKLDPDDCTYDYEMGFAYIVKEDYKSAIKVLKKVVKCDDTFDIYYQLLGNAYDYDGQPKKAQETYDAGLKLFPNSGKLYLEKGNVFWNQNEYNDALPYYEKGIELDPSFSSNYYRASLLLFSSTEIVWAMIYGEIFVNLERNTKRTSDISKLLFDNYKSQIEFTSDTSMSVSFSKNVTITLEDLMDTANFKLPFGIGAYEPTISVSLVNEKEITLESLNRIRKNFVTVYFDNGNNDKYPNALFDYQKKILDAGHMEAYNYWLLMDGDEEAFKAWKEDNNDKWVDFVDWFDTNKLELSETNKFYRMQY